MALAPVVLGPMQIGTLDRLASKIEMTPECWNWTGTMLTNGYGQFKFEGKKYLAHRFVYEAAVGPISEGLQIDHLCRNTRCVNPDHLEPVTPATNQHRGNGYSGINFRKTHCVNGHEFTEENTYHPPGRPGRRHCRACGAENERRYQERRKGR